MQWKSAKDEDRGKEMNTVVEGLGGETANIAMGIGQELLLKDTGRKPRIDSMRRLLFPNNFLLTAWKSPG